MSKDLAIGLFVAETLENLDDLMWTLESEGMDQYIRYKEEDVMHALKVFMHVAGNVAINHYLDTGEIGPKAHKRHEKMGRELRAFVKEFTGYDPHDFYKRSTDSQ